LKYYKEKGLDHWFVYSLEESFYEGFLRLAETFFPNSIWYNDMEALRKELPIQSRRELAINGHDLMQWFPDITAGPWLEHTIHKVEMNIVNGTINNTKGNVKEWLKWNPPEIN